MEGIVGVNIYDAYDNYIGSGDDSWRIYDASGYCRGYLNGRGEIYGDTNNYLGFLRNDNDIETAAGDICGWVNDFGEVFTYKTLRLYVRETDEFNRLIDDGGYVQNSSRCLAAAAWLLGL